MWMLKYIVVSVMVYMKQQRTFSVKAIYLGVMKWYVTSVLQLFTVFNFSQAYHSRKINGPPLKEKKNNNSKTDSERLQQKKKKKNKYKVVIQLDCTYID